MDLSPDLLPDLAFMHRRRRAIRSAVAPRPWRLIGGGCLGLIGGVALGVTIAAVGGGALWAVLGLLLGLLVGIILLKLASDRETERIPWARGEPMYAILLERTYDGPALPSRAALVVNALSEVARDADAMLTLRNHVRAAAAVDAAQSSRQTVGVGGWLTAARGKPGRVPPLRLHPDVAGDRSTWLLSVPLWPEDLPPSGADGVALLPVLRARPAKTSRAARAFKILLMFFSPQSALLEALLGPEDQPETAATRQWPFPRVRPIPFRFWSDRAATIARLPRV